MVEATVGVAEQINSDFVVLLEVIWHWDQHIELCLLVQNDSSHGQKIIIVIADDNPPRHFLDFSTLLDDNLIGRSILLE